VNKPAVPGSDPRHHSIMLRQMLHEAGKYAREDIEKIQDARARALFEVTAEVLGGLTKAFRDYEENAEPAWR
jgi:hypothetical protein